MFRPSRPARPRALRPELECLEAREVPATIVGVTEGNVLDRFDSATPGQITTIGTVTGLAINDFIVGLAFRPATGGLYALGFDGGTTEQLYTIDPLTAAATAIGARFDTEGMEFVPTGMTFDPVLDQVRVSLIIGSVERDIRLDPATASVVANDANITPPQVVAIAHSNPFAGATSTTLYGYNYSLNAVVTVNTATGAAAPLGPSGVPPSDLGLIGLAIGGDNAAYLVAGNVSDSQSPGEILYSVNLATGAATSIGPFDPQLILRAITVAPAVKFSVGGFPSPVAAGTQGTVNVTALDVYGQLVPGYRGTVTLSSTDPAASLQSPHTLTGGTGTFTATLNTVGTQSLIATDTRLASITGRQTGIVVQAVASVTTVGGPRSVSEAFGPSGAILVLVAEDGTLMQFDAAGTHVLGGGVRSANVTLGPAGEVLLVVFDNGALVQFDAAGAHVLAGAGVRSASAAFGPAGEVLDVVLETGDLVQFDAAGAHLLGSGVKSASVAFGPAGQVLVVAMQSGGVYQFDASGAHQLGTANVRFIDVTFLPHQSEVLLVLFENGTAYQFDEFGVRLVL